jgi:hypothetical protein
MVHRNIDDFWWFTDDVNGDIGHIP